MEQNYVYTLNMHVHSHLTPIFKIQKGILYKPKMVPYFLFDSLKCLVF